MTFARLTAYALFLALLLPLLPQPPCRADTDSASGPSSSPPTGRGRKGKRNPNPSASGAPSGSIHGSCMIVQSLSNPIAGPCVSVLLVLDDEDGNEVVKDRTSPQGQFEFNADLGKNYKIHPGSKFYDLLAPTGPVRGGDHVEVRLQQN